jgi:translocation and assembly module TamA
MTKLAQLPAFFISLLLVSLAAPAQTTAPLNAAFEIRIEAPTEVRELLTRHMELYRYRELTDMDAQELTRLLQAAQTNVQDLLATLGYFAPSVELQAQEPMPTGAPREVLVRVVPGQRTTIAAVEVLFEGPIATAPEAQAQREDIQNRALARLGQAFTQADWDQIKTIALRQLSSQRYPGGRLSSSLADIDPSTHSARLKLVLDSGPAYQLGALRITGLQRYDFQLAERLSRLPMGGDYRQEQLLAAQQRLTDSGFFDSALVWIDTDGDAANAPVNVQVQEAKLQKMVIGLGASTDSGPRASVEHTHHQLPGLGWRSVSSLLLDRDKSALQAELTAPPDADLWRWSTAARWQEENVSDTVTTSQRYRVGRTQLGEAIDRNHYLQLDRARTLADGLSTDADSLTANVAWTLRHFAGLPFPSAGQGLGLELGVGSTLGANRYPFLRTQARWLGLWPLSSGKGRLAARLEAGLVVAATDAALPSTQLFLTGGDTSVRGYAYHSIGVPQADGHVTAGRQLAVGSLEWQRPIRWNGQPSDWESTLFIDAGGVGTLGENFKTQVGVGTGVRWKSPVGPLQLDLAYGAAVQKFRLHLRVGFAF